MKKIFKVLSMLVLVCLVGIVLGSCNDNDQNNENPTTYKVMNLIFQRQLLKIQLFLVCGQVNKKIIELGKLLEI